MEKCLTPDQLAGLSYENLYVVHSCRPKVQAMLCMRLQRDRAR